MESRFYLTVVGKAAAFTALAVASTFVVFLSMRAISGVPYTSVDLLECAVIPVVVGAPILVYLLRQSARLQAAHDSLAALNHQMEETHHQLKRAHALMAHAASHDKMTGLPNRERFLELLQRAHSGRDRDVLLIVDADHFKQINDRLGHLKGDDALVEIARAILASVRKNDVVGRIGGEEFGVLLRNVSLAEAAETAERIRLCVEAIYWAPARNGGRGLSVSIGGAALSEHPAKISDVMMHADRCLYAAKRAGRNCVSFHYVVEDVA